MPKKKKNDQKAIEQAKYDQHIEELRKTKYEISALTLAQISELLQHLGSIPYFEIAGMIGNEIKSQLPEEAQKEIAENEAKEVDSEELEPTPEPTKEEKPE